MTSVALHIEVSSAEKADLRERLRRTRFTGTSGAQPWAAGVDPDYLQDLVQYWLEDFDWSAHEQRLNSFEHRLVDVGDHQIHCVRMQARHKAARHVPIVLLHGWPSAFTEMLELGELLTGAAAADSEMSFEVIIPSLPGFLYSGLPSGPLTREAIADDIHALMTELGHDRYAAFGGDIGGAAANWLGAKYAEHLIGMVQIHPPFPASLEKLSAEEQAFVDAEEDYDTRDGGYSEIMGTRPDTIAASLLDSPAGLLAWIIDKYRDWSDCGGDLESRFDRDTLLTVATLYWTTGSIGSSFRQYFDWHSNSARPMITVPVAYLLSNEPSMKGFPRSIAERAASDIRVWAEPNRGGHFMAHEEPQQTAEAIRSFFATVGADTLGSPLA